MTDANYLLQPLAIGFVGLGDMGAPMANNLASNYTEGEMQLSVFDINLHKDRIPANADTADSLADIACKCEVVFMSVPDGASSLSVVKDLLAAPTSRLRCLINLSTVGIDWNEKVMQAIPADSFDYIDAPVSGGKTGAINATITIMWSGNQSWYDNLQAVLSAFAKSLFFVGDKPGQGQALKLLNNFLSGVAMTATSEAMRFGLHHGLDMKTMLDVVHVSTGQNTAISDKFQKRVLTGSYDAGFRMALMQKDIALYQEGVTEAGLHTNIVDVVSSYWQQGAETFPDGDFTEIFKLIDKGGTH